METHPIQQPIREIDVYISDEGSTIYTVGRSDVTRIEACTKPGPYCDIPYVRVWKGEFCEAELCQHNIVGVYFEPVPIEGRPVKEPHAPEGGWPADHTGAADCLCTECIPF